MFSWKGASRQCTSMSCAPRRNSSHFCAKQMSRPEKLNAWQKTSGRAHRYHARPAGTPRTSASVEANGQAKRRVSGNESSGGRCQCTLMPCVPCSNYRQGCGGQLHPQVSNPKSTQHPKSTYINLAPKPYCRMPTPLASISNHLPKQLAKENSPNSPQSRTAARGAGCPQRRSPSSGRPPSPRSQTRSAVKQRHRQK